MADPDAVIVALHSVGILSDRDALRRVVSEDALRGTLHEDLEELLEKWKTRGMVSDSVIRNLAEKLPKEAGTVYSQDGAAARMYPLFTEILGQERFSLEGKTWVYR